MIVGEGGQADEGKKENATRARFNEEMGCKNSRVQNAQKRALLYLSLERPEGISILEFWLCT